LLVACGETVPHGRYVVIELTDTGVGMDEPHLERIFDPFFTTKDGERSGLGLSTCLGIVRQAGGYFKVESRPKVGSTFSICLPEVVDPGAPTS
jgi:two-component system cell cycle sensor histidine kinase/response regulator CckA